MRARWYAPSEGVFLSRDPVESEPPYLYVRGNPVNLIDPSGMNPPSCSDDPTQICYDPPIGPSWGFNSFDDVMAATRGAMGTS
ncbi:MAG: hypothetical protein HS126_00190 [Anaerolineales bacterium]|nr:hypothetical protein [Anaerolineales bacterium]